MEKSISLYEEDKPARSYSSNNSWFKDIQSKVTKLYQKNYNKIDFQSIKYLEFQTHHKELVTDENYSKKLPKPKDKILEGLQRDHITQNERNHVYLLPKTPWGNHHSYNNTKNFSERHILIAGEPNNEKINDFKKKVRLFNKIVRKNVNKYSKSKKQPNDNSNIYKTKSGNMYCKKYTNTEKIYDNVNDKFRKIREFKFENSEKVNSVLSKLQTKYGKTGDFVKRLYTPSPKTSKGMEITEKYRILFE